MSLREDLASAERNPNRSPFLCSFLKASSKATNQLLPLPLSSPPLQLKLRLGKPRLHPTPATFSNPESRKRVIKASSSPRRRKTTLAPRTIKGVREAGPQISSQDTQPISAVRETLAAKSKASLITRDTLNLHLRCSRSRVRRRGLDTAQRFKSLSTLLQSIQTPPHLLLLRDSSQPPV